MSSINLSPAGAAEGSAGAAPLAAPAVASRARIAALDFAKGALVLIMVLYHWLNYFVGPQGFFYRYLSFLPPSFICISGFLVSQVYLSRPSKEMAAVKTRLAVRGMKILGIFLVLNVAVRSLFSCTQPGCALSAETLARVFITGNMAQGRAVAFYVLVPISYLLLLSAGVLMLPSRDRRIFHTVTGLLLVCLTSFWALGIRSANLELLAIGCIGISLGFMSMETLNRVTPYFPLVLLLYMMQLSAITVWNVPFPLQVSGVILMLILLYIAGGASTEAGGAGRLLFKLGKYSLFGYIAQIAILQVMHRIAPHFSTFYGAAGSLVTGAILTVAIVEVADRLRAISRVADRIYKAVFA